MADPRRSRAEGRALPPAPRPRVWIIGRDRRSLARILTCLESESFQTETIPPEWVENEEFALPSRPRPALIVLEIEDDVDWGARAIDRIRRMRIGAPIIVVTNSFTHEFGAKIISRGVPHYFPRDFSASEFLEVVHNLTKSAGDRGRRTSVPREPVRKKEQPEP